MSEATTTLPKLKVEQVSPDLMTAIRDLSSPVLGYLRQQGPSSAVNILTYLSTAVIMDLKLRPGASRQHVLESYLTAIRQSVEGNIAIEASEKKGDIA